jgi:hypothetical protein
MALVASWQRGRFRSVDACAAFLGLVVRVKQSGRCQGRCKLTPKGDGEVRASCTAPRAGATQLSVGTIRLGSRSIVPSTTTFRGVSGSCHGKDAYMKTRLLLIAFSSLVLVSFADAQTATTVAASPLPPTADYSAFGPFTTSTENSTGPDAGEGRLLARPHHLRARHWRIGCVDDEPPAEDRLSRLRDHWPAA